MFWIFRNRRAEDERRIKTLESKMYVMQQTMEMVKMSLNNLQSALLAMSTTQDAIGQDVCNIGEVIENIVNVFEHEPNPHLTLVSLNPDDDLPN